MGDTKQGAFDISSETAQMLIEQSHINPNQLSNRDVIKPWCNGLDITRRSRNMWIIDFGVNMSEEDASQYVKPFEYVKTHVKPIREAKARVWNRPEWWLHYAPRIALRKNIESLQRYIATPIVAKYRLFVWLNPNILPDHALIAFTREDDYFFGVLHSRIHEVWSLRMCTWLGVGNDPRYTPTTTFETFPFPYPPNAEPDHATTPAIQEIAELAKALDDLREGWLHPDPTTFNGGVGNRYQDVIKKRTLTNLYNALENYRADFVSLSYVEQERKWSKLYGKLIPFDIITELYELHRDLDQAVLEAYGWSADLTDDQILEQLLALNAERAAQQGVIEDSAESDDDEEEIEG